MTKRLPSDKKLRPGFFTVADVKANCDVDPVTGCWHWKGAKALDGTPRMWAVDYEMLVKRSMSGPKAMWGIAHGEAPRKGWLVFRSCVCRDCLNPVHLSQARDKKEIGEHIARSGRRKGNSVEQRRASVRLAWAAAGVTPTPPEIVRAIRAADQSTTNKALGLQFGISCTTVGRIRLGQSHRDLLEVAA